MSHILIWLLTTALVIIPYWKILSRTGCDKSLIILPFILALGILIYWYVVATSNWPNYQYGNKA